MKRIKSIGGFSIYEKSEKELAFDKKDGIISSQYNVFFTRRISARNVLC